MIEVREKFKKRGYWEQAYEIEGFTVLRFIPHNEDDWWRVIDGGKIKGMNRPLATVIS